MKIDRNKGIYVWYYHRNTTTKRDRWHRNFIQRSPNPEALIVQTPRVFCVTSVWPYVCQSSIKSCDWNIMRIWNRMLLFCSIPHWSITPDWSRSRLEAILKFIHTKNRINCNKPKIWQTSSRHLNSQRYIPVRIYYYY